MVSLNPPQHVSSPDTSRHVLILSTAAEENAREIAALLIQEQLAACVNLLPVRSVYRWEGTICDEAEHLMLVKTSRNQMDKAITAIRENHRYDLPEVIVLPITGGSPEYLAWVDDETRM